MIVSLPCEATAGPGMRQYWVGSPMLPACPLNQPGFSRGAGLVAPLCILTCAWQGGRVLAAGACPFATDRPRRGWGQTTASRCGWDTSIRPAVHVMGPFGVLAPGHGVECLRPRRGGARLWCACAQSCVACPHMPLCRGPPAAPILADARKPCETRCTGRPVVRRASTERLSNSGTVTVSAVGATRSGRTNSACRGMWAGAMCACARCMWCACAHNSSRQCTTPGAERCPWHAWRVGQPNVGHTVERALVRRSEHERQGVSATTRRKIRATPFWRQTPGSSSPSTCLDPPMWGPLACLGCASDGQEAGGSCGLFTRLGK